MNYKLNPSIGSRFDEVAKEAKEIAYNKTFSPSNVLVVEFDFNGITCLVDWGTDLHRLKRDYNNAHMMGWKTIGPKTEVYNQSVIDKIEAKREGSRIESEKRMKAAREAEVIKKANLESKLKGIEIDLIDINAWNEAVTANKDGYGKACLYYTESWAKLMQHEVSNGKSIAECQNKASHEADTDGITGFMHSCAVSILIKCWTHGEELRLCKK